MYTNPDCNGVRRAYSMLLCAYHWERIFTFLRYFSEGRLDDEAEELDGEGHTS